MANRRLVGLLLRVVLLWCCAAAVVAAQPRSGRKAIGFSNLVFRPKSADQVGIAGEDFRVHILEDLRGRGLNAVGEENLVFGSNRELHADLMLGGTVTELECQGGSIYGNVTCRMGVEWQVLDVASDAVVYKLLSRGRVTDVPKEPTATLAKRLIAANVESLTKHVKFQHLLEPEPQTKPTQGYARANLRGCKASPRAMPAASEQVLDATVLVQTSGGFGSGFVLGPDGFVVTAAHVVPESSATVKLRDGREFPATVIRVDRRIDIALLRLGLPEGTVMPCLPVKLDPIAVGADVYAIGSPASRDLSFSLARGIVSGVRLLQGVQYLQTDAAVSPGNSGGPLVTGSGQAAAIVSFKLVASSVEGIAFGVPLGAGLNALSVTPAEAFTSQELVSAGAAAPRAPNQLVVDAVDAQPELSAPQPVVRDTSVKGTGSRHVNPYFKRTLIVLGVVALATGATGVLAGSTLASEDKTYRNVSWALAGGGGVLIGIGLALP